MSTASRKSLGAALLIFLIPFHRVCSEGVPEFRGPTAGVSRSIGIPTIDISGERHRQVVVARGTEEVYQGHCDTALMADGKTLFVAWCLDHAGRLGPLSRSDDGGLTWSAPLRTPEDWKEVRRTTPVLHRLKDPSGVERLFLFGGCDFPGNIRRAFSEDEGRTWSAMEATGLIGEVAPKSILPFDGGRRLVMWSDRRDPSDAKDPHPVVWQSESLDGGLTWGPERVILRVPGQWAQPSVVRSADGQRLLMLMRENTRRHHSLYSVSDDDARTWSEPRELPAALTGDRHVMKSAGDGRLVVAFRDMSRVSPTYGHYVAWVGTFDDIIGGREGQYRIKLMHNGLRGAEEISGRGNSDCGYSDLELLDDGTLVATTYIKMEPGPQRHSVVSMRFKLAELDAVFLRRGARLFTDRDYVADQLPAMVDGLPFHRTSIERTEVVVTRAGTLFVLTPSERPKAASQEIALRKAGFVRMDGPEAQLFPGEVNRVVLYRRAVRRGERFQFNKMVLLALSGGATVRDEDGLTPSVVLDPGPLFQDEVRPGAMVIGMERTSKGRLWGCWTGTGDKAEGYFLLATSDDGGDSWTRPRVVVGARTVPGQRVFGALVGNLWTDPRGRLWLFFDQQVGDPQKRITNWYIRCDDPDADRPEWTEPVMFAEGCTLNKPTVLKSGDWLLPVSDWHRKTARIFVSKDEGSSWVERGHLQFPDWEFDEHMMVELRDGRLWMLARTKGQPHESFSLDSGATWSDPKPARTVQNINARFFLRRLRSGRILLVKNGSPQERLKTRSHMSAWISEDEGETWKGGLILDERVGVSYPDGVESSDGCIRIIYDWNRHTDAEILMARFREEDVLAGKPVSADVRLRMLANKATGPKPELLHNGIQLPSPWPPPFRDPRSADPMEVPYLKGREDRVGPQLAGFRPKTVPIDVGRQLFVDDFLVEKTDLVRTFHKPRKFEGNPVFKPETASELGSSVEGERGEEATVFTGQGGIFYDPSERLFKLFHVAGWRGALSVATSTDMIHWDRPDLRNGKGNQLLPRGLEWKGNRLSSGGSDNCVWLDLNAVSPAERLKYLTCWMHVPKDRRPDGFNHSLHVSDGKTWSDGVTTGMAADDYCSFFFNPFRKKWCFSIKRGTVRGRSRYYHESDDFMKGAAWDRSVFWTSTDRLDEAELDGRYPGAGDAPQLYSLNAVAYESLMVGMHYIHRGPKNEVCDAGKFPKLVDLELGFSRDGFHWDRPDRSGFISGSRREGAWDRAYLHGAAGVFVVKDDELVFPYMGTSGVAPSGARGMYTGGSIGLAILRRDGFASMDGPGELLTRPLRFSGTHLFVNLRGSLQVEALDSDGRVVEVSTTVSGDGTRMKVPMERLSALVGKPMTFRFRVLSGSLFSFWVTRDADGASFGYVGAGGPAFSGTIDDGGGVGK